ncbi:hypothetical protein P8452_17105 [Trifolium repens]|nr:hypothetical protein P8452_17105 [Trifolium repens]
MSDSETEENLGNSGSKSNVASNTSNPPPVLKVKAEPGVVVDKKKKKTNPSTAGASKAPTKVPIIDLSDNTKSESVKDDTIVAPSQPYFPSHIANAKKRKNTLKSMAGEGKSQVKKKTKGSSSKVRIRRVLPRKAKAPQQVPQQQQPICISSDEIDEDWAEFLKTYKPSDEEFLDNSFGEEQFDSPPSEGFEVVKPHSSPVSPSDFDEDYVEYLKTYQPPDEYADDELLPFVIQQRRSKGAKPSKGKSMPK